MAMLGGLLQRWRGALSHTLQFNCQQWNSLDQCPLVHSFCLSLSINKEMLPLDIQTHKYLCWEFPIRHWLEFFIFNFFFHPQSFPWIGSFRHPARNKLHMNTPNLEDDAIAVLPSVHPGILKIEPIQSKYLWLKEWIAFHMNKDVRRQSPSSKLQWWMLCFPFAA